MTWRAMRAALPVCTRQSMGILPLANRASDFTFLLSIARAPFLKFPCFVVLRLLAPPVAERLHWLASVPPASSDDFSLPGFPSGLGSYVSERLLFVSKFRPRPLTPANFTFEDGIPPSSQLHTVSSSTFCHLAPILSLFWHPRPQSSSRIKDHL